MKKALLTALALLFTVSVSGLALADDMGSTPKPPKKSHKKHHGKKPKHNTTTTPAPSAGTTAQ